MSRAVLVLFLAALPVASHAAPAQAAGVAPLSDAERDFCANEVEVLEKRERIFAASGLSPAEIAKRNEMETKTLAECRSRWKLESRRAVERAADEKELIRRAGADATELERARIWAQIRRERLVTRNPADLTPEEKAELAAGMQQEVAETHATLDTVHSRDPDFMRQVHSALACYHGDRKEELTSSIEEETAHLKLGTGDRQRLYALQSDLRQSEDVLARSKEAAREYPGGLIRCSDSKTAILARCLAIRFDGKKHEPACDAENVQQYIRFVR
ncbi:MAG TPA: hypothetical protein VLU43_09405 [Anaeromyxobacteraceae bacterium]|nr:hypothetical protein [Anaeromyxobacteraceae bacterium]